MQRDPFLSDDCPPMDIYEIVYALKASSGQFMGTPGTQPWSQGSTLTTQLDGGPPLPGKVDVTCEDRFYPKAWGHPALREAICKHYNGSYGSSIAPENVMVFAGSRPAIYTVLAFLEKHVEVRIGNAEWPACLDILTQTGAQWRVVPFSEENGFHPPSAAYFDRAGLNHKTHLPCPGRARTCSPTTACSRPRPSGVIGSCRVPRLTRTTRAAGRRAPTTPAPRTLSAHPREPAGRPGPSCCAACLRSTS